MSYLTFISHSSEDTWVAEKLSNECRAAGADIFLDRANIAFGTDIDASIFQALGVADELLVLITPWALERFYIWTEIGVALFRKIPIIVLLHGLSPGKFRANPKVPGSLKQRRLLTLNETDQYIEALTARVDGNGGAL